MADGSAPKPYPDADVDLVAEEIAEAFNANNRACTIPADFASEARAVLDALAEAGRLLPEGWTVREQFGVTAEEDSTQFGPITVLPERSRETALERVAEEPDWSLRVVSRMISDWQEVSDG